MKFIKALPLFVCLVEPALAQEPVRVGLSLPLSGPYKLLGDQALAGAQAAAKALVASRTVEITLVDDKCTAEGGKAAAVAFAEAKVEAVAGLLCTAPLIELTNVLTGVPIVTVGVRTDAVTKIAASKGASIFRLTPTSSQELDAVAELIVPIWQGEKFAIIDDGTLRAREISESLRLAAEAVGAKPVLADTFKPGLEDQFALLSRLKKIGATHVFAGGDREDIAILAQNARSKNITLTVAASESLKAAPTDHPLPDGVLMVGLPETEVPRLATATGTIAEGFYLPAYAAIEIISLSATDKVAGKSLSQSMSGTLHQTVLGDIRFAPNGDLLENPYALMISRAGIFEKIQR